MLALNLVFLCVVTIRCRLISRLVLLVAPADFVSNRIWCIGDVMGNNRVLSPAAWGDWASLKDESLCAASAVKHKQGLAIKTVLHLR
jgi:hypothetical protein